MQEYGIPRSWVRMPLLSLICIGLLGCGPVVRNQASTTGSTPEPGPKVVKTLPPPPVVAEEPVKPARVLPPAVKKASVTHPIIQLGATVELHHIFGLRIAFKDARAPKRADNVIMTIRRNRKEFLRCVKQSVNNYPYYGGRVGVLFTIGAVGTGPKVNVVSDTTSGKRLGQCLKSSIEKLRFRGVHMGKSRSDLEGTRYKLLFKVPLLKLSDANPSGGLFLRQKGRNLVVIVAMNHYCDPRPRFRRLRRGRTITYTMRPTGSRISRCTKMHERRFVEKNVKRGRYTVRVVNDGEIAYKDTIDIK